MSDSIQDQLLDKLTRLDDRLDNISVTLAEQHVTLKEHMRRTELLEHQMESVWGYVSGLRVMAKLISAGAALVAILGGAMAFLKGKH